MKNISRNASFFPRITWVILQEPHPAPVSMLDYNWWIFQVGVGMSGTKYCIPFTKRK
jgi:hypothetical protein